MRLKLFPQAQKISYHSAKHFCDVSLGFNFALQIAQKPFEFRVLWF